MLVKYLGASLRKGTSAKTGRPYEIGEIAYAIPDESGSKADDAGKTLWVYTGYGTKPQTIELSPAAIHDFKDVPSLTEVQLLIEPKPTNPRHNWVVGSK